MGGDEFIIILPVTVFDTEQGLSSFGHAINETISQPLVLDGRNAQLGASVGLAMHAPGMDADQLISLADHAMYEAKRSGGGLKIADASSAAFAAMNKAAS